MIKDVAGLLSNSKYAVVFTGAGISAESGIPTFRGANGCGVGMIVKRSHRFRDS